MEVNSFGSRLHEYRRTHFLTQLQMAQLLGISPNHIGVLERGLKKPRPSTEAAFAQLSGYQPLVHYDEQEPSEKEALELLCTELGRMEPEHRKEILDVFRRILMWSEKNDSGWRETK